MKCELQMGVWGFAYKRKKKSLEGIKQTKFMWQYSSSTSHIICETLHYNVFV